MSLSGTTRRDPTAAAAAADGTDLSSNLPEPARPIDGFIKVKEYCLKYILFERFFSR